MRLKKRLDKCMLYAFHYVGTKHTLFMQLTCSLVTPCFFSYVIEIVKLRFLGFLLNKENNNDDNNDDNNN